MLGVSSLGGESKETLLGLSNFFLDGGILKMFCLNLEEARDLSNIKFEDLFLGPIILNNKLDSLRLEKLETLNIRYVKFLLISPLNYKVHQMAIYFLPILLVWILLELNLILNRYWC